MTKIWSSEAKTYSVPNIASETVLEEQVSEIEKQIRLEKIRSRGPAASQVDSDTSNVSSLDAITGTSNRRRLARGTRAAILDFETNPDGLLYGTTGSAAEEAAAAKAKQEASRVISAPQARVPSMPETLYAGVDHAATAKLAATAESQTPESIYGARVRASAPAPATQSRGTEGVTVAPLQLLYQNVMGGTKA